MGRAEAPETQAQGGKNIDGGGHEGNEGNGNQTGRPDDIPLSCCWELDRPQTQRIYCCVGVMGWVYRTKV